jgi:hypothetical protein
MTPKPITRNSLFYGNNLQILREHVPDESVDLIYLTRRSIATGLITCSSWM